MTSGLNPRLVLWLRATGRTPEDLERVDEDEVRRIPHPETGQDLPWTIVFSEWVRARWRDWATGLGYRDRDRALAHELAIMDGRNRDGEFDVWLGAYVSGLRVLRRDGVEVTRGTELEVVQHLHRLVPYSVEHATRHEGYEIAPVEGPERL